MRNRSMKLRGLLSAALIAFLALASGLPAPTQTTPWTPPRPALPTTPDSTPRRPVRWVNDEPDTGQFLPDTTLLGRVAKREIRVGGYVNSFFSSYAEFRPKPDSAGRI